MNMDSPAACAPSRFSDRVLRLLERVEHRRAETAAEKEAVYQLRHEAYLREHLIEPLQGRRLYDEFYDEASNCYNIGTYIDGELASTIRIHVAASDDEALPSSAVFKDLILPRLKTGQTIVDPTRFATKLEFSRRFPEMPYLTVRPGWMAGDRFGADYILATMRSEHQAYYKRVFGHVPWSGEREYPRVHCKIVCMGLDFAAQKDRVETRYPFFRSTEAEREKLFGDHASVLASRASSRLYEIRAQA
jgi:hypothetical protein